MWSPGSETPVRVEFFGDTVDSIRRFDPETQLSVAQLQEAEVVPMREVSVGAEDFRLWAMLARERWPDEARARALKDRTVHAEEGETFAGWEWMIPLVAGTDASAFDYLGDAVLVVDEPAGVEQYLATVYETLAARYAENEAAGEIGLKPEELYLTPEELRGKLSAKRRVELRALGRTAAIIDERFAGEAEQPAARIGRERAAPQPLFLFPAVEEASEVEWRTLARASLPRARARPRGGRAARARRDEGRDALRRAERGRGRAGRRNPVGVQRRGARGAGGRGRRGGGGLRGHRHGGQAVGRVRAAGRRA